MYNYTFISFLYLFENFLYCKIGNIFKVFFYINLNFKCSYYFFKIFTRIFKQNLWLPYESQKLTLLTYKLKSLQILSNTQKDTHLKN